MPEEINRILTDNIADYLFITEQSGVDNLKKEGILDDKVFFVGNVMIDSLVYYHQKSKTLNTMQELGVKSKEFMLVTMHRPANVDIPEGLKSILEIIEKASQHLAVIFPIHPRTRNNMEKFGLSDKLKSIKNLILTEPQGYLEFLNLMDNAKLIITDSGGIQEETTFLQVPCLTFRDSTERPVTVELGTNQLLSDLNADTVYEKMTEILDGKTKKGIIPPFWDGHTAGRIAAILFDKFEK